MRFQLLALSAALRRQVCRRRFWLFTVLILAGAIFMRMSSSGAGSAVVTVGVVLPDTGANTFWNALSQRGSNLVAFIQAEEETVIHNVAASRWDCGLVLSENLDTRLAEGDWDELVRVIIGPGSTVFPLIQETVAAVLLEESAPWIARDYLIASAIATEDTLENFPTLSGEGLLEGRQVEIVLQTVSGEGMAPLELVDQGMERMLLGLLAVLLLVWALGTAADLGRWKESSQAAMLLAVRRLPAVLLPHLSASLLPALVVGGAGAWSLSGLSAAIALVPYLLILGVLAMLLAESHRAWAALPALTPFVAVAGVTLSPVFLDPASLLPWLAPVLDWLPTTLYLRGSQGDGCALTTMLLLSFLLGIPAFFSLPNGMGFLR